MVESKLQPRCRHDRSAVAIPTETGWRLQAEHGWVIEASPELCAQIEEALPRAVCERLARGVVLLSFGNHVGRYRAGPLGTLIVHTGKWGEADYDHLLERITEEAAALPYSAGTPSALPFDRTMLGSADVLYHAFSYLRHVLGPSVSRERALLPMLQGIVRNPHRRFQRVGREVPLELARHVEHRALLDVVRGRWPLDKVRGVKGPMAVALQGHQPSHIEESVACDNLDTAENRFVKCFLDVAMGVVERMRDRAAGAGRPASWRQRVQDDCAAIERTLQPIKRHGLWRDVGRMVHFPASSTVLQRRLEYREVFRHYNRLRLGSRLPLDTVTAEQLLEVKNVALLYEMWACFALVKAVRGVLGEPQLAGKLSRDDHQLAVGWDYEVRWAGGTRVLYNVSFSRSHAATRRSYSVPLRPDVVLEVPAGGARQIHVFDAKFKVDWLAGSIPDGEDHQAETENVNLEREGTFKRADIYKMHAYRDAIPAAMSAWALYPGTQLRFFPKEGGGAIEQVSDLPESLEGVGAVPLSSGEVGEELRAVVSQILRGQGP